MMEIWFSRSNREVRITDGDGRYLRIGMVSVGDKRELGVIEAPEHNAMARAVFERGAYGEKVWQEPGYSVSRTGAGWSVLQPDGTRIALCESLPAANKLIDLLNAEDEER